MRRAYSDGRPDVDALSEGRDAQVLLLDHHLGLNVYVSLVVLGQCVDHRVLVFSVLLLDPVAFCCFHLTLL